MDDVVDVMEDGVAGAVADEVKEVMFNIFSEVDMNPTTYEEETTFCCEKRSC